MFMNKTFPDISTHIGIVLLDKKEKEDKEEREK